MGSWSAVAPAVTAAFLASIVEAVEAFTIVLAAATLRGWRPAALGTTAGLALLAAIVLLLGPLLDRVPIHLLQLAIGILLLLFGLGWLRKASLRAVGIIPLHDEDAIFASEVADLAEQANRQRRSLGWAAGITALKAVLLEGVEVVFIVIAVGAGPASGRSLPARWCSLPELSSTGRCRASRRILSNLASASCCRLSECFGPGKGLGIAWPGQDLALLLFAALFLGAGLIGSGFARKLAVEFA